MSAATLASDVEAHRYLDVAQSEAVAEDKWGERHDPADSGS